MFKFLSRIPPIFFAVLITGIYSNRALAQVDRETLNQIEQYTQEGKQDGIDRITNVNQLKDVSPTDWSYEAIRGLNERYGCISGLPDGTFKGDRPITRNEFAAGLNSCFQQIERSINSSKIDPYHQERIVHDDGSISIIHDAGIIDIEGAFASMVGRIDELENRTVQLENNQFSTTTKITGETIFNISDTFR